MPPLKAMNTLKQIVLTFIVLLSLGSSQLFAGGYWLGGSTDDWNVNNYWNQNNPNQTKGSGNGTATGGSANIAGKADGVTSEIVYKTIGTTNSVTYLHLLVGQPDWSNTTKSIGIATINSGFTLTSTENLVVGRHAGTGTLNSSGTLSVTQNLIIGMVNDGANLTVGSGTINLNDGSVTTVTDDVFVGGGYSTSHKRGVGTLTLSGNAQLTLPNVKAEGSTTERGYLRIGRFQGGSGTVTVKGTAKLSVADSIFIGLSDGYSTSGGYGTLDVQGGTVSIAKYLNATSWSGQTASEVKISGGTVTVANNAAAIGGSKFTISGSGKLEVKGDHLNINTGSSLTVSGGELVVPLNLNIDGTSTFKITGGKVQVGNQGASGKTTMSTPLAVSGGNSDLNIFTLTGTASTKAPLTVSQPSGSTTYLRTGQTTLTYAPVTVTGGTYTIGNFTINDSPISVTGGKLEIRGTGTLTNSSISVSGASAIFAPKADLALSNSDLTVSDGAKISTTENLGVAGSGGRTISITDASVYTQKFFKIANSGSSLTLANTTLDTGFFHLAQKTNVNVIGGKVLGGITKGDQKYVTHRFGVTHNMGSNINFTATSTGLSTLRSSNDAVSATQGTTSQGNWDALACSFSTSAAGIVLLNDQTTTLVYSPHVRNDSACWSMEQMKLTDSNLFDLSRTYKVNGVQKTDQGGIGYAATDSITELSINATLNGSAFKGGIILSDDGNSYWLGGNLNSRFGVFSVDGEAGEYTLELNLDGVTDWDGFLAAMSADSSGENEFTPSNGDSKSLLIPITLDGTTNYFAYDFTPYAAYGTISVSGFGGASEVPEPATWALLLLGVGYILRGSRFRRGSR